MPEVDVKNESKDYATSTSSVKDSILEKMKEGASNTRKYP